jgi:hypothetical protein
MPEPDGTSIPDVVQLPSGDALDLLTAAQVTAAFDARVIVIAGAEASGKTTLITTIYEAFQAGPFAGFRFAGSRTLVGFEQRCHRARIASGAAAADTDRTKVERPRLLHFAVHSTEPGTTRQHVLLTDIAGEIFRLARDSTAECKKIGLLLRADTFVVLLDGKKLADPKTRADAAADGLSLIRSCLDAKMIGRATHLNIVVTKRDEVEAKGQAALDYVEHVRNDAEQRFGTRVGRLAFTRIAARPIAGRGLDFAHGCDALVEQWVRQRRQMTPAIAKPERPLAREFERFAASHRAVK